MTLDKPDFGQVIINGKTTSLLAPNDMAGLRRDYIGFVFQNHYMNPKLRVKENLEMPMRINKKIKKAEAPGNKQHFETKESFC